MHDKMNAFPRQRNVRFAEQGKDFLTSWFQVKADRSECVVSPYYPRLKVAQCSVPGRWLLVVDWDAA